jgi:hypothetical protein
MLKPVFAVSSATTIVVLKSGACQTLVSIWQASCTKMKIEKPRLLADGKKTTTDRAGIAAVLA